jgi:DNA-binding MarR family transcriptional regulator
MIGALIRIPVEAIYERIIRGCHDAGFDDFVRAHMAVFRYPGPQGKRPSEIAAETGMSRQAVNYLLGQLEELGYLIRSGHPDDARSRRIDLTDRGERLRRHIRTVVSSLEHDLEEEMGVRELAQLRRLLQRLNGTSLIRDAG